MLEIFKFALEGPMNFIGILILSVLWSVLATTIIEKFKPINIAYVSQPVTTTSAKNQTEGN